MGAGELSALRVRLNNALAVSGLTKSQLAVRAGRSRTVVYQALRDGDPAPSPATVAALAQALGLPVDEVLEQFRTATSTSTSTRADSTGEPGEAGGSVSPGENGEPVGSASTGSDGTGGVPGAGGMGNRVHNSVSGTTTVHGSLVQAGSIGALTLVQHQHAPPPPAPAPAPGGGPAWPLRIGAVPDLVTAHQPRTALREQIHRAQSAAGTVVLSQVLSGGGGVGKTQLAAALAHHAGIDGTDLVLWADATRAEEVLGTYAAAALLVQAPGAAGQDVESDARAFLNWAATTGRSWLVVLDDVTEPDALRGWWPPAGVHDGGGQVPGEDGGAGVRHRAVITTRLKGADISGGGRHVLDVSTYTAAESAAFLRERLTLADAGHLLDEAVDEIGDVLGHLPLALGYAAAWMINEDQPCAVYVEHFRDQEQKLDQVLPARGNGEAYGREVAAALLLSLDAAQAAEPVGLAAPALDLAAFLDPAGHPAEFWQTGAVRAYLARARRSGKGVRGWRGLLGRVFSSSGRAAVGPGAGREAMRLLHRYGLITTRHEDPHRAVQIHALTARAVREALSAESKGTVVRAVADALLGLWPEEDHHDMARATVLRANTDHLWPLAGDLLWQPDGHELLYQAGSSHWRNGLPTAALAYWECQVAFAERLLGAGHPDTLTARANLATSYWTAGRTREAVQLLEQVLADSDRLLGPQHPDTLTARANLATSYWTAGRTGEAIALEEQVLADRDRLLGPRHPDTLTARANLANSYRDAGRTSEAIELLEQVLADSDRLLGPQHPDTLTTRANLAASYWTAGRTGEAIEMEEQVLADSDRLLGPQHPDTLTARANLAASYRTAGRTGEAIALEEQVLADSEHLLGHQHPDTLNARANLAASYRDAGRTSEAIELLVRVLADREQLLGPQHLHTLNTRANLATSYQTAGRTREAIDLQEQVLADREHLLGPQHRDTLNTRANLATSYHGAGREGESVGLLARVVEDSRQVLGEEHPHTRDRVERLRRWREQDDTFPQPGQD
ncbi:tetratricopeptide repeat protein [Streptomyces sp. NPDC050504]|uniref:tetratricopeptide repeat protein n=1 Tax=Streptomyces sp. NPDC050504 TaxID=3365618 RepID=UPI0037A25B67